MDNLFFILWMIGGNGLAMILSFLIHNYGLKKRVLLFFLASFFWICICSTTIYHVYKNEQEYKRGQVDYYKGKFNFYPIIHKSNDIVTDTIYLKKEVK